MTENDELYRMVLKDEDATYSLPADVSIHGYEADRDHEAIRTAYGKAFDDDPWSGDWDEFDEFDPKGAFVALDTESGALIGYVLSFERDEYGYISVLGVVPGHRRRGIGFALVRRAVRYLRDLGLETIKVDAFVDAEPAVALYQKLGFKVEKTHTYQEPES